MLTRNLKFRWIALAITLLSMLPMVGCQQPAALTERIRLNGVLIVGTLDGPTTFYSLSSDIYGGFDYTLATRYADRLGVAIQWRTYDSSDALLADLANGRIHIAAAGLAVTPEQASRFFLAPAYSESVPVLVHRSDTQAPKVVNGLEGQAVTLSTSNMVASKVRLLEEQYPGILWDQRSDVSTSSLLADVNAGHINYAVVSNHVFNRLRHVYPELRSSLSLGQSRPLAWALNRQEDASLLASVSRYFADMRKDGTLAQLTAQFFASDRFDYVGARAFLDHMDGRLPRYENAFRDAARQFGFDWRLLAAISYQESLWNPNAVSSTGVTGIMMLSNRAALEMGVRDRRNAHQNIRGGTRYFRYLADRLPDSIKGTDRLWFALAAYNMGLGHVYDARRLTLAQGGNPDCWLDVEKRIPLLQKAPYYQKARHGYAKAARQAVAYVRQIRRYYDTIVWASQMTPRPFLTVSNDAAVSTLPL
jgi:membrane-bound lytic murein transglycosylase F